MRLDILKLNHSLNPFPNKPCWFLRVCCTSLLKTLWEKEKLPEASESVCTSPYANNLRREASESVCTSHHFHHIHRDKLISYSLTR